MASLWLAPFLAEQAGCHGWMNDTHPLSFDKFAELNFGHIHDRVRRCTPSPHWPTMLTEILQEKSNGKLHGPFSAPASWTVATTSVAGHDMSPPPTPAVHAAVCFAVEQGNKVRRCEDFRHSTTRRFMCSMLRITIPWAHMSTS